MIHTLLVTLHHQHTCIKRSARCMQCRRHVHENSVHVHRAHNSYHAHDPSRSVCIVFFATPHSRQTFLFLNIRVCLSYKQSSTHIHDSYNAQRACTHIGQHISHMHTYAHTNTKFKSCFRMIRCPQFDIAGKCTENGMF